MDLETLEIDGFEWDQDKNFENLEKHGVDFEEAQEAVENADRMSEPYKTRGETRYLIIGPTSMGRMQVVITMRGQKARIITARRYRP